MSGRQVRGPAGIHDAMAVLRLFPAVFVLSRMLDCALDAPVCHPSSFKLEIELWED